MDERGRASLVRESTGAAGVDVEQPSIGSPGRRALDRDGSSAPG
jgi:hypothetical protein